jgi:hypothetical protein
VLDSHPGEGGRTRSRSTLYRPPRRRRLVHRRRWGLNQAEVADAQSWLSLLVRTLMVQLAHDVNVRAVEMPRVRPVDSTAGSGHDETVLPSSIPWQSPSEGLDAYRHTLPSPSPYPKRLSQSGFYPDSLPSARCCSKSTATSESKSRLSWARCSHEEREGRDGVGA